MIRRLRRHDRSVYLWADAVCINQNDPVEKGHQVSVIGQIFSKANYVRAWLGEAAYGSEEVMGARQFGWNTHMMPMLAFSHRPYWTRTWIDQEFLLAREVIIHCGDQCLPYATLQNLTTTLMNSAHLIMKDGGLKDPILPTVLLSKHRESYITTGRSPFMVSLVWSCHMRCTDKRDMVYAKLPISKVPKGKAALAVDYTISETELYFRTFEWCHEEEGGKRIFAYHLRKALGLEIAAIQRGLSDRPGYLGRLHCSRCLGAEANDIDGGKSECLEDAILCDWP